VRQRNARDAACRYNENELYDSLVRHLFKRRFYQADHFRIWFARRGRSDRNKALGAALEQARRGDCLRHPAGRYPAPPISQAYWETERFREPSRTATLLV
jgi:hypothetical protein